MINRVLPPYKNRFLLLVFLKLFALETILNTPENLLTVLIPLSNSIQARERDLVSGIKNNFLIGFSVI